VDWWIIFPTVLVIVVGLFTLLQFTTYLVETLGVYWRGVSTGEVENRDKNGFVKKSRSAVTFDNPYTGLKAVAFRNGYLSMYRKGRP